MTNSFKDLNPKSIQTLQPLISFWSTGNQNKALTQQDLNKSLNDKLDILIGGMGSKYIAEYAITYAVLLDDLELLNDLCDNGAVLNIKDSFHEDKTPVHLAVEYGRSKILQTLLEKGAEIPEGVVVPSNNMCTFLWSINEKIHQREADFQETQRVLLNKQV